LTLGLVEIKYEPVMANLVSINVNELAAVKFRAEIPVFKAGDQVVVTSKVKEGNKERQQAFEGVVISRSGTGISETFIVRKRSAGGIGVERIYPLHSPNIVSIERKKDGFIRRAKLYYIRELEGKKARIRDRNLKLSEASGSSKSKKAKKKS